MQIITIDLLLHLIIDHFIKHIYSLLYLFMLNFQLFSHQVSSDLNNTFVQWLNIFLLELALKKAYVAKKLATVSVYIANLLSLVSLAHKFRLTLLGCNLTLLNKLWLLCGEHWRNLQDVGILIILTEVLLGVADGAKDLALVLRIHDLHFWVAALQADFVAAWETAREHLWCVHNFRAHRTLIVRETSNHILN